METQNFNPQFTKTPWYRDAEGFISTDDPNIDVGFATIADFDCSGAISISEREANKNLAIAAPDMFAALKNLVERDLIKDPSGDHFDEVIECLEKATQSV